MSIFKNSWIILKITSLKESEFLFDVFSYDFWKLKLKSKKNKREKLLDVWYIIDFEINVQKENNINEVRNIKIKNEFDYLWKDYEIILEYLNILKIVDEKCPLNMPIFEIFNIINEVNKFPDITNEKLIFAQIKIYNILWILNIENRDEKIKKILKYIRNENIKNILKLKWLDLKKKEILKNILVSYKN